MWGKRIITYLSFIATLGLSISQTNSAEARPKEPLPPTTPSQKKDTDLEKIVEPKPVKISQSLEAKAKKYNLARKQREIKRNKLRKEYKKAGRKGRKSVLKKTRKYLYDQIVNQIFPKWYGVPFIYKGRCGRVQNPYQKDGCTHCSGFSGAILKGVGFKLDRDTYIRQDYGESYLTTKKYFFPGKSRDPKSVGKFVESVKKRGEGIYTVALDKHMGFLVYGRITSSTGKILPKDLYFIQASYFPKREVVHENAMKSPTIRFLRKFGPACGDILSQTYLQKWLFNKPIIKKRARKH